MQLIYVKDIDKSVLYQGFTIKTALLEQFTEQFGKLGVGESRNISIIFDGKIYSDIQVINQNFDRNTYPDHSEMYQVRYSPKSDYAVTLRNSFREIAHFVEEKQRIKDELKKQGLKTPNIQVPEEIRGSLSFYVTTDANIWEAIPTYDSERSLVKQEIIRYSMNEMDYEQMLCPNHHRIVHAYNPHFSVQKKEYVYPNGLHEKLKLNLHL